ncbi:hypothetical protein CDL15_Pgr021894 [Punica granatum]|uniref:Uncharacterized protein n=1 Tax=Punica granatum TaxID=22663 RepID=A0A218WT93_PUNGR|nr:hypothetical protein CDL15_Pgr021894 [Punica granatum]PKI54565.1 hypothetical protein CRG98_025079 [Punica granatum]
MAEAPQILQTKNPQIEERGWGKSDEEGRGNFGFQGDPLLATAQPTATLWGGWWLLASTHPNSTDHVYTKAGVHTNDMIMFCIKSITPLLP